MSVFVLLLGFFFDFFYFHLMNSSFFLLKDALHKHLTMKNWDQMSYRMEMVNRIFPAKDEIRELQSTLFIYLNMDVRTFLLFFFFFFFCQLKGLN